MTEESSAVKTLFLLITRTDYQDWLTSFYRTTSVVDITTFCSRSSSGGRNVAEALIEIPERTIYSVIR